MIGLEHRFNSVSVAGSHLVAFQRQIVTFGLSCGVVCELYKAGSHSMVSASRGNTWKHTFADSRCPLGGPLAAK